VDAVRITEREHLHPIIGQEVAYNLVQRDVERELIPACQRLGLGLTTYAPLAGGLLAGARAIAERPSSQLGFQRWRLGEGPGFNEREIQVAQELDRLSDDWGPPSPQLALSWLLTRPTVASVIIGPESVGELEQNAPAGDLKLDESQLTALDTLGASQ
jgi:aryl-alcohol dehydrogenase-like predicted oxidoreductase